MIPWYLVHYLFSGLLNCYVDILRSICSLVCFTVTLVIRPLIVFWFVQLLRWHLAQCFSFSLINCYVDISRTIYFLVCLTVKLESRALAHYLFSSFFNYNVNVLRTNCFSALFNYCVLRI